MDSVDQNFIHPQDMLLDDPKKQRSSLTLVLCILGFVGVGVGVIYYAFVMYMSYAVYKAMQVLEQSGWNMSGSSNSIDYNRVLLWSLLGNGFCLLSQFISLLGLILIFRMKKSGFVLYLASELLALAAIIFVAIMLGFGSSGLYNVWGSGPAIFVLGCTVVFDFAFIIMHIINFKNLE